MLERTIASEAEERAAAELRVRLQRAIMDWRPMTPDVPAPPGTRSLAVAALVDVAGEMLGFESDPATLTEVLDYFRDRLGMTAWVHHADIYSGPVQ